MIFKGDSVWLELLTFSVFLAQRPGAFAMYLEPWHFDIFDFLELKKNTGKEEQRARDLFYALWIPDLFMKRVETNGVSTFKLKLFEISDVRYIRCLHISFIPQRWKIKRYNYF